jgi:serine/threonine protein kinase/WD40 repeat protein
VVTNEVVSDFANEPLRKACAELERRLRAGEACQAENILAAFPAIANHVNSVLELIYTEFVIRQELGQRPSPEEYYQRFPHLRADLAQVFAVHRFASADQTKDAMERLQPGFSGTGSGAAAEAAAARGGHLKPLEGYEILEEIGRGGMGVVYRARQVGLNRIVALKMILAGDDTEPEDESRFRTEAEAAAALQHANIVQIYEIGIRNSRPYFSMEYLEGGNLHQKLAEAPVPAHQAAEVVAVLARAVHYAHEHGVIHRDLKPGNILLTGDGIPKITDFGLAKRIREADGARTRTGAILGTPSYMAPEQAEGRLGDIGPTTDIYALGTILYESLTGRPPFRTDSTLETLLQVRTEEPVSPRRLQSRLPKDIETICLKCLQKEPRKRYQNALALAEDLQRFLEGEPIQARPVSRPERLWRWCRRKPTLAASLAFAFLLLLFISFGAPLAAVVLRQQRNEARQSAQRAQAAEQDAKDKLWHSYLEQAKAGSLTRQSGQRFKGLDLIAQAASIRPDLELRNQAIACMALPDLRVTQEWANDNFLGFYSDFDPQLQRYASMSDQGDLRIRSVRDNLPLVHLSGHNIKSWYCASRFSPDGQFLAAIYFVPDEASQCLVWDLLHGETILQVRSIRALDFCLDFSPDSRQIVTALPDGALVFYDLTSRKEIRRLRPTRSPNVIAFHPNGRQLVVTSAVAKSAQMINIGTGAVHATLPYPAPIHAIAWRRDGRLFAMGCEDKRVYVYDTATWQQQAILEGHDLGVIGLAFNHAGEVLASSSWDGTTRLWDAVAGKLLVQAPGRLVHFSLDDRHLAFTKDERIGVWEVADGRECRTLHHGQIGNRTPWPEYDGPWDVDFSPDGRLLASASGDGTRLWDSSTSAEIAHLPVGNAGSAQFHPKGTSLLTYGHAGLFRWPIRPDLGSAVAALPNQTNVRSVQDSRVLQIGPPQVLIAGAAQPRMRASWSGDGRRLAFIDSLHGKAFVLSEETPALKIQLNDQPNIISVALSPDGHWAATGSWRGNGVRVWDVSRAKDVKDLPAPNPDLGTAAPMFSPYGDWLVVAGQGDYRFYRVGSWEAGPILTRERPTPGPGPMAFTRDGRLLAIVPAARLVQLIDVATGQEIARLQSPDSPPITWLCFSHDGSKLAVATFGHVIQLWDLRSLRQQLAPLTLDWDLPPIPEAAQQHDAKPALVKIDLGGLRQNSDLLDK